MANAAIVKASLEVGAANVALDGVNSGIAAGDVGTIFDTVARAGRNIEPNWLGVQIDITGAPASVLVTILGSLDGVNYYTIATYNATTGGLYFIANYVARSIKTVLTTLTGGTAPTVKVQLTQ